MKIDINNPKQILSHFLLGDEDVALSVAETPLWKESGDIIAKVTFNGIELPAEILEKVLKDLFNRIENIFKEEYDAEAFDKRVEEKAKEILKEHSDKAMDKLQNLLEVLEDPENVITPYWERNK